MYTKKMHAALRRDTEGKQHNHITDLLDEIERLQAIVEDYEDSNALRESIETATEFVNLNDIDGANDRQTNSS